MPPLTAVEDDAIRKFLKAFNLEDRAKPEAVGNALFSQRQLNDHQMAKNYVDQFFIKCSQRDPHGTKPLQKRANAIMSQSESMVLIMDFLVRCRQSHLFHEKVPSGDVIVGMGKSPSTVSSQSSPFQRRAASRTRVHTTLTGDPVHSINMANESTRSRANSSFTSYDSRQQQNLGMERSGGVPRQKSPFRISNSANNQSLTNTPLSASNHLFSANGYGGSNGTPSSYSQSYRAHESPSPLLNRNIMNTTIPTNRVHSMSSTPLHSRIGSAMCETESIVCECLLSALLGIDSRLFRSDGARKMNISSTASLTTTHLVVSNRILNVANVYTHLSQKESFGAQESQISEALLASIRYVLGDYTADIDLLRRQKNLTFSRVIPVVDQWNTRLTVLNKCYKLRKLNPLEILDFLYVIHRSFCYDPIRKPILDKVLDYTMGVFCKQMIEWMTTGEVPTQKWIIEKNTTTKVMSIRRIPVFMTAYDVRILLEIGKSLPQVDSTSDEDLAAIDQATAVVSNGLTPKTIFNNELAPLLRILRDVVCGIVMRTVLTTGRLKEHLQKATSFFFLADPRFTSTLYMVIKEASMGLRIGSASLNTQQVRSALAAAIGASGFNSNEINSLSCDKSRKKKLMFVLDSMTSLGNTPNVSSRMQFVQPLRPRYEPTMDLMKPIFYSCDSYYEAIFHVIWAIDLARLSSQEATSLIPSMLRFLELNYSLRENAWSLIQMISHIFFVINSTLTKVRNTITIQTNLQFSKFLAAIDEKCVDVDDVIEEHLKFVKRVSVVVYLTDNEVVEQQLAVFLQTAFEAQDMIKEFSVTWEEMIESSAGDLNVLKAKIADNCKKRVVGTRILLEKINNVQKKLIDEIDHQIAFGNDALID